MIKRILFLFLAGVVMGGCSPAFTVIIFWMYSAENILKPSVNTVILFLVSLLTVVVDEEPLVFKNKVLTECW